MELRRRPSIYSLPSYSLTSDLLGFLRCGLQYRYTRIGKLPSTRPVQLWFGQFIHGVMEESFRQVSEAKKRGETDLPPWPTERIESICELIKRRLAAQGLFPWDDRLEDLGDRRAAHAINELGPELLPLIHRAEVRLTGARVLPLAQIKHRFREAERYEMVGVIDVITHVELDDPAVEANQLVRAIRTALPGQLPERFEVIIDYKGMRRPALPKQGQKLSHWDTYAWQVQTYGHLRAMQDDALPVATGVLIYVNELAPTRDDLTDLLTESRAGTTDVPAAKGSEALALLEAWRTKHPIPVLPLEFRLARALRLVPITSQSINDALVAFDSVVASIENSRGEELNTGRVVSSWDKDSSDDSTCTACDARTFCPAYAKETGPRLPGVGGSA